MAGSRTETATDLSMTVVLVVPTTVVTTVTGEAVAAIDAAALPAPERYLTGLPFRRQRMSGT